MAYREVSRMEIKEIMRRWQVGNSQRRTAASTGLSRDTVRKYLAATQAEGIAREDRAPTEDQLSRLATISWLGPRAAKTPRQDLLEPWAARLTQ